MKPTRIVAIARKEFLHIIHDPRSLVILFLLPAIQIVIFGYALNLEIQQVNVTIADLENSPQSREFIRSFSGSSFFRVTVVPGRLPDIEALFLQRRANAALLIPQDFSKRFKRDAALPVQVVINAADPNAAIIIRNYFAQTVQGFNARTGGAVVLPFDVSPRLWYNPDLKSVYFFVPGLLALILVMICALLTSITITREKELGTMEQILVSPVRPPEIILGKVLPYMFLALLDGFLILAVGMGLFSVPFAGSLLIFVFLSTLYIFTALSLGLMISTITRTQQVAMMLAQTITLLPTLMLSGFIFPIPSMPKILQWLSHIIPARYYLIIVRGIMLKGNSVMQLLPEVLVLAMMSFVLLIIARRKFQTNLEG